jgi:AMMECR1 domain-containing protein
MFNIGSDAIKIFLRYVEANEQSMQSAIDMVTVGLGKKSAVHLPHICFDNVWTPCSLMFKTCISALHSDDIVMVM